MKLKREILALACLALSGATGASCYIDFQRLCRASELSLAEVQSAIGTVLETVGDNVDAVAHTKTTLELTHESMRLIASICR